MEQVKFETPRNMVAINDRQDRLNLSSFLARPTHVKTLTWDSTISDSFYPWYVYCNNAQIQNKLKNYGLLRGNITLRFEMSSSPTVFGAAIVSYCPIHDRITQSVENGYDSLVLSTQRPCAWLLPQESSGIEMVLPFIWRSNYLNIIDEDFTKDMGRISIESQVPLDTSNDVAPPILTIQVYAWIEDAMVEGPTAQLVMQAGSEFKTGPIQRIASAVATVANALSVVPMIQPFALATEMGAKAMSSIASLFGWSKVPVIENAIPVNTNPFHGLATSEIIGPVQRLTLDAKAETTVDPRIVNLTGKDELNLNYLTSKESFFHKIDWVAGDASDDLISLFPVAPNIRVQTAVTNYYTMEFPPISYFSHMFKYWRGDIIFRFKIIATKYHRGRIRITFDPFGKNGTNEVSNVAITKIVDISNESDIEFVVPYMQDTTWIRTPSCAPNTENYTTGANVDWARLENNGTLAINVVSPLTSPQAVPTAFIFVSVRGGANFELAIPQNLSRRVSHIAMQSGTEITAGKQHPQEYLVNFGENITSMRQVLSRCSLSQTFYPMMENTSNGTGVIEAFIETGRTPAPPGYDSSAVLYSEKLNTADSNERFVFSEMHPINWVAPCFLCMRGSLQNLYTTHNTECYNSILEVKNNTRAANDPILEGEAHKYIFLGIGQQGAMEIETQTSTLEGQNGFAIADPQQGEVLHVEVPSRTPYLFSSTRQEDWYLGEPWDLSSVNTVEVRYTLPTSPTISAVQCVKKYVNIGTDFNLHFFISTPIVYYSEDFRQSKYVAA